ncbi:hypothetical protein ACFXG4_43120 [Nocardia sp. NPDC059246]|uniref:hypothetical protein n=1 Tax=unclassified Nocardia TaxID=2637762 RepID=UPI0036C55EBB
MNRSSLVAIAERLASNEPMLATGVRAAVDENQAWTRLIDGLEEARLMGYIDETDPEMARDVLEPLKFCPASMSWDWWEEHREDEDED